MTDHGSALHVFLHLHWHPQEQPPDEQPQLPPAVQTGDPTPASLSGVTRGQLTFRILTVELLELELEKPPLEADDSELALDFELDDEDSELALDSENPRLDEEDSELALDAENPWLDEELIDWDSLGTSHSVTLARRFDATSSSG